MQEVQSVSLDSTKANFKADDKRTQQRVYAQPMVLNQQQRMDEFQKEQKKQKTKQNISLAASITMAGAFLAMAGITIYQFIKSRRPDVAKTIFAKIKESMPGINDDCTSPKIRDKIRTFVGLRTKSAELKAYAGTTNSANMILIYGVTGSGKTFTAKQLAKEMNAFYGEVQFSELSSEYVGKTAVNITAKFKEFAELARKNPNENYVICFNEIDSLIVNVDKLGSNNLHLGQNRTAFLNGLDYIKDIPNLTVVGTTNINPKTAGLDPATLSRFGDVLELGFPSVKEIKAALKFHLKNSDAAKSLVADNSKMEQLAQSIFDHKGTQRDVFKIVEQTINEFGVEVKSKSETITADRIQKIIDNREVWPAAISNSSPELEQMALYEYLEKQGLTQNFSDFLVDYIAKHNC